MLNRAPTRCAFCKVKFTPEERAKKMRLHPWDECIDGHLAAMKAKKERQQKKEQRARARVERAMDKKVREAQRTWSDWHADAQKAVNAVVRLRDAGEPCISCGTPWKPDFQAGHYRSRGAAKNLALDLRNIHGQCVQCNLHKHSNAVDYRLGLVGRYGPEFVEALECDNAPRHYSTDDLKVIASENRAKARQLKKEQA